MGQPSALIDRMNFALALAASDVKDVKVSAKDLLPKEVDREDAGTTVDALAEAILHQPLGDRSRTTLLNRR